MQEFLSTYAKSSNINVSVYYDIYGMINNISAYNDGKLPNSVLNALNIFCTSTILLIKTIIFKKYYFNDNKAWYLIINKDVDGYNIPIQKSSRRSRNLAKVYSAKNEHRYHARIKLNVKRAYL